MTVYLRVLAIGISLTLGACGQSPTMLAQTRFADHGLEVTIFDEGLKLSTRHVRVQIENLRDTRQTFTFETHLQSLNETALVLRTYLAPNSLRLSESDSSVRSGTVLHNAEDFTLAPLRRAMIYFNTGSAASLDSSMVETVWID